MSLRKEHFKSSPWATPGGKGGPNSLLRRGFLSQAFSKELRFIRIANITGFRVTGAGTVDGNGADWWAMARANEHRPSLSKARPPLVGVESVPGLPHVTPPLALSVFRTRITTCCCSQVHGLVIDSVTLQNSPRFHLPITHCSNVTIEGITVASPRDAPNTDGS